MLFRATRAEMFRIISETVFCLFLTVCVVTGVSILCVILAEIN